jgi:hypothetical protein
MKPFSWISYTLLGGLALTTAREKSNMPPHAHHEPQSPQGPNTLTRSFARNGASTRHSKELMFGATAATFNANVSHVLIKDPNGHV